MLHLVGPSAHADTAGLQGPAPQALLQGGSCSQPGNGESQPGPLTWSLTPRKGGASPCHNPGFSSRSRDGPTTQTPYATGASKTPRSPTGLLRLISRAVFHRALLGRGNPLTEDRMLHDMTLSK